MRLGPHVLQGIFCGPLCVRVYQIRCSEPLYTPVAQKSEALYQTNAGAIRVVPCDPTEPYNYLCTLWGAAPP